MNSKAEIMKKYRLKKAIINILKNHLNESYFITLTFNNDILENTTKAKRLLIIKNYLNNQTDKYILNCDYGKLNEREHYHALVIAKDKFINFTLYNLKYGHIQSRPLNLNKNQSIESQTKILLNHALKETSESKIYYSRSKRANHIKKNKNYYINPYKNERAFIKSFEDSKIKNEELIKTTEEENKRKLQRFINDYLSNYKPK